MLPQGPFFTKKSAIIYEMSPENSPEENEKIDRLRQAMYSRTLSEQLKARDRRNLEPSRKIVGDDFVHVDSEPLAASTVAPRGMGFARSALWWILGAAFIFFVCAIGFFAYYFIYGGGAL